MHGEAEATRRFETEGLRRRLEEKDEIVRAQRKEIASLRVALSTCRCADENPHSGDGQGSAMAGQILALRRALKGI